MARRRAREAPSSHDRAPVPVGRTSYADPVRSGEDPHPARGGVRAVPAAERATTVEYRPEPDGRADPGEVVWAWVPYEEDSARGKDRPLLVVARRGRDLVGLLLSAGDHAGERDWLELGGGTWDRSGRVSYVRLDRVFEVEEDGVRREGAVLDPDRFERVAAVLRRRHGWT